MGLLRWMQERGWVNRARLFDTPTEDKPRKRLWRRLYDLAHFTGMSSVQATIGSVFRWQVGNNLTGSAYSQVQNAGTITKNSSFTTSSANGASGGADEVFSFQQTIANTASATIDLTSMTNLLQQAAVAIVRVKGFQIRNLNITDDSTINSPGSFGVVVTNIAPANPSPLWFQTGGVNLSLNITINAGNVINSVALNTNAAVGGGSGWPINSTFLVTPIHNTGSGATVLAQTNATGVVTTVTLGTGGANYAAGSVPGIPAGSCLINGGGFQAYSDVIAAGFLPVSSTQKKFTILNLDTVNTATVEIDCIAGTT